MKRGGTALLSSIRALVTAVALGVSLVGCTHMPTAAAGDRPTPFESVAPTPTVVRVGVIGKGEPQWPALVKAAAAEGITVELVDFADPGQVNPATDSHGVDLSQTQNLVSLAKYNVSAASPLIPIGSTAMYPLGLYSRKYQSAAQIPDGQTVAVSHSQGDQAHGLLLLQSAGLIKLGGGGSVFATLSDIDPAASRVKVIAIDPSLSATTLPDVAGVVMAQNYLRDAGLTVHQALVRDAPTDASLVPYVGVFTTRVADRVNPLYLNLVRIFQTDPAVQAGLVDSSGGTAIPVQISTEVLEREFAKTTTDTAATRKAVKG